MLFCDNPSISSMSLKSSSYELSISHFIGILSDSFSSAWLDKLLSRNGLCGSLPVLNRLLSVYSESVNSLASSDGLKPLYTTCGLDWKSCPGLNDLITLRSFCCGFFFLFVVFFVIFNLCFVMAFWCKFWEDSNKLLVTRKSSVVYIRLCRLSLEISLFLSIFLKFNFELSTRSSLNLTTGLMSLCMFDDNVDYTSCSAFFFLNSSYNW